jgi:hypothetical protein
VYLLTVTGQPRGTLFQPRVRDLGRLSRDEIVRAVRARVPDDRAAAGVVVEPIRAAAGDVLAYVVRPADLQLSTTFTGPGGYTVYVRGGRSAAESGGGGAGGGGGM